MKADIILRQQIEKALQSNMMLNAATIDVAVVNCNAYLSGSADKYYKKELARKIAKEVDGVKQVDEQISIILNDTDKRSDKEIADFINERFKKNFGNSYMDIMTIVKDGQVWLEGRLKWNYQKDLAEDCILEAPGIISIENNIFIPQSAESAIDEKDVFAAIYGDPSITTDIKIEIIGARVLLKGKVPNAEQKNLVTRLVRNVEGVKEIENFLTVTRTS